MTFKFIEVIGKTLNVKSEDLGPTLRLTCILLIRPQAKISSLSRQLPSLRNVEITTCFANKAVIKM